MTSVRERLSRRGTPTGLSAYPSLKGSERAFDQTWAAPPKRRQRTGICWLDLGAFVDRDCDSIALRIGVCELSYPKRSGPTEIFAARAVRRVPAR